MDRISKLKNNEILKELQQYSKYQNQSQKTISEAIKGIAALRKELYTLEIEALKRPVTREFTDILPDDVIDIILLQSSFNEIKSYCLSAKKLPLCQTEKFWKKIFTRDHLTIINTQHTSSNWINEYQKVLEITKEVDIILEMIYHRFMTNGYTFEIYIIPKHNYRITVNYQNDHFILSKPYTREEFKNKLIKIIYKNPNAEIFDDSRKGIPLRYKDLLQNIKTQGIAGEVKMRLKYYKNY